LVFEPILWSQLGSFFVEISKIDRNYFPHALNYAQSGRQIFESSVRQKKEMKLAHWAELANLHLKLFQLTGDSSFLKTAGRTLDWLCTYQMETGAFKATNKSVESALVYTRGVGKIAEVLASVFLLDKNIIDSEFNIAYYKKSLEKAFHWLVSMQYSLENSFFVPQENLPIVLGGFRENYANFELWLDGAGHFILAAARFLKHKN